MIRDDNKNKLGWNKIHTGQCDRLQGAPALLLVYTPVRRALEGFHLVFNNESVFCPGYDNVFVTKRKISGNSFLKEGMVFLNLNELFRIVFTGKGPHTRSLSAGKN